MSGPISIQCPKCNAKLKLKNSNAVGKKVPCPKCKKPFVVEAPPEPEDELDDFGALDDFDSYEDDEFDEQPTSPRRRASASAGSKRGKSKSSKGKKKRKSSDGAGLKKPLLIGFGVVAALGLMVSVGVVGVKMLDGGGVNNKIDMTYLPPDAEFIVSLQVADAWDAPLVQSLVSDPMLQMQLDQVTKEFGIKLEDIDSVIFGATGFSEMAKGAQQQPAIGLTPNFDSMHGIAVVRTKISIDTNKLNTGNGQTQTLIHEGQEYYLYSAPGPNGTSMSLFLPDRKTLVIGPEPDLKAAIERGSKEERREDLDFINDKHQLLMVVITKNASELASQNSESLEMLPEQLKKLTGTMDGKIVTFCLGLTVTDGVELELQGDCKAAADAEIARKEFATVLDDGRKEIAEATSDMPPNFAGIFDVATSILGKIKVSADGTTFAINMSVSGSDINTIKEQAGQMMPLIMAGMMSGMGGGMPGGAVPGGGNFPTTGNPMTSTGTGDPIALAREAARRMQCKNNLKQIGLAMHNFHDVHKQFPTAASVGKAGKPLLSWRVQLLPFLGQASLYEQFKLDEPWDSTHNKKLIAQMPAVFTCPSGSLKPGTTTYLGVSGERAVFNGTQKISFRHVTDGSSKTLMVVDADDSRAVTWTKPDDFTYSTNNPSQGLIGHHGDGFTALFCDLTVRFLPADITEKTLNALFTRSGGEDVKLP